MMNLLPLALAGLLACANLSDDLRLEDDPFGLEAVRAAKCADESAAPTIVPSMLIRLRGQVQEITPPRRGARLQLAVERRHIARDLKGSGLHRAQRRAAARRMRLA